MRVVVVGAGLAGLVAGEALARAGHTVVVLDKGRGPGGRLATRRIGGAVLDHGAQFFTVRTPAFASLVATWEAAGLVATWSHGFRGDDGHPRHRVAGGMNALAKHLASRVEVLAPRMVFGIRAAAGGGWSVVLDDATTHEADAVVVTPPLPQAYALTISTGVELPEPLRSTDYHRCLALLTVLDGPAALPAPGGLALDGGVLAWVGDNLAKGISAVPSLTAHATPQWSLEHWDDPAGAVLDELTAAVAPWLGAARPTDRQLKRWRFASPVRAVPEPCWVAPVGAPLVLAGDAFCGSLVPQPCVEAAALSGLSAAHALDPSSADRPAA